MSHIDSTKFGEVVVDGISFHQVLIIGDKVEERDTEKLKKLFDTTHKIGEWEIEGLISNGPEIVIIGTGQSGTMGVDEETIQKLQGKSAEVIIEATPKAIGIYNEKVKQGIKTNALIHTTC